MSKRTFAHIGAGYENHPNKRQEVHTDFANGFRVALSCEILRGTRHQGNKVVQALVGMNVGDMLEVVGFMSSPAAEYFDFDGVAFVARSRFDSRIRSAQDRFCAASRATAQDWAERYGYGKGNIEDDVMRADQVTGLGVFTANVSQAVY